MPVGARSQDANQPLRSQVNRCIFHYRSADVTNMHTSRPFADAAAHTPQLASLVSTRLALCRRKLSIPISWRRHFPYPLAPWRFANAIFHTLPDVRRVRLSRTREDPPSVSIRYKPQRRFPYCSGRDAGVHTIESLAQIPTPRKR